MSAKSRACSVDWVNPSGFNSYSVLIGSGSINASHITGNTGYNGTAANMITNSTFNGTFSYGTSGDNPAGSGNTFKSGTSTYGSAVSPAYTAAQNFASSSSGIACFTDANLAGGTYNVFSSGLISAFSESGSYNDIVINNGANAASTLTITGSANQTYYINVWASSFCPTNIVLAGGITANNVYWNILTTSSEQLSGSYNCTILDFNGWLTIGNSSSPTVVDGGIYGSEINLENVNCVPVPEPSTWGGLGAAFGGILLIASRTRRDRRVPAESCGAGWRAQTAA